MIAIRGSESWPLVRFIVPVFPEVNIFTRAAQKTTSLGIIMVATAASKVWGCRAEVIDENNYRGPCTKTGLPDHIALQQENPASVVGFYCGLTSTMERVFELANFYKQQGAINLAGGWHAHYHTEEVLRRHIDIVVHGDGEIAIQQILQALINRTPILNIPGISFWCDDIKINPPQNLEIPNLDELPYPDFGLLEYTRRIKYYPISRVRGCGMNCEFCSVKGKPR